MAPATSAAIASRPCAGLATTSLPSGACTEDEDGVDFGGRIGYDQQMGRLVFGALVDVSMAAESPNELKPVP